MDKDFRTNPITQVPSNGVVLSFDDGPRPNVLPSILDTLAEFNAHACFFVCGQAAAEHPQLLGRIVAEGHELGNHTWSHLRLTEATEANIIWEIEETQRLLEAITGKSARFFRPPYGKINPEMVAKIEEKFNMRTVLWSIDPSDWSSPGATVIHSRITSEIKAGDIVLLHERQQTGEALPEILLSLQSLDLKTTIEIL